MWKKYCSQAILTLTVMIWGSLYVAGRVVLAHIPALFLLFLRFAVASALLLGAAKIKKAGSIRREDWGMMFFVGFFGYFLSNAALLLGIQYSNASFSSLINAMCPIFISLFAVLILKERMDKKDGLSLLAAVAGAVLIIGSPGDNLSGFGIFSCICSLVVWSYVTIYIKKLSETYDPILVTGYGMAIAGILSLPASLLFMKVSGETVQWDPSLLLPVLYICVICTAVSHLMWNHELSKTQATQCAAYYPIQPLTSMVLGVLMLGEKLTVNFLAGAALVVIAMIIHGIPGKKKKQVRC